MEKIKLNYTHNNSIAQIILNTPKGNVLDKKMMVELLEILKNFKEKKDLKLITFEGEGEHFSFGASVEEHKKEKAAAMLMDFHQVFYSMIDLSIPTMAKISGFCLGGGLELALMCNLLFADRSAKLGQPESLILPLKIGYTKAEGFLITGRNVSADEAKSLGIINEIYPDKISMDEGVNKFIEQQILPKSASSLRYVVKATRTILNEVILNKLPRLEKMYLIELMETSDANEGIQAFLEKRKPLWVNS
jgi:cyclohexa-1,5-dienecarbonyl-CoA hydratase